MITNNNHSHFDDDAKKQDHTFFSKLVIPYQKSKAAVWSELDKVIPELPAAREINHWHRLSFLAVAATALILTGTSLILRFYSTTMNTSVNEHFTVLLPDNSKVEMNAESTLRYHPFWWRFSRNIQFSGEGYFEIEKGSRLEVSSSNGTTIVLGTSFNIYNRENKYKVTCHSGKVKVVSKSNQEAVLTPGYHADVNQNGSIAVNKVAKPEESVEWIHPMFNFTSVPLEQVFRTIETHYNISIETAQKFDFTYTAYFPQDIKLEECLNLICKPFGLTFVKISENKFLILQK